MLLQEHPASPPQTDLPERPKRALDNPRVIAAAVGMLLLMLAALVWLSERTGTGEIVSPLLSDALLKLLYAVDLTILAALLFVLARNLVKLWVERRRAEPFARFRGKLVAALLAMTIVPAVLMLITGSEIITNSTDRWFSAPVDEVLDSAKRMASQYYREHQEAVAERARRLSAALPPAAVVGGDVAVL